MDNNYGKLLALRLSVSGLEAYINATALEECDKKTKDMISNWFKELKQGISDVLASKN